MKSADLLILSLYDCEKVSRVSDAYNEYNTGRQNTNDMYYARDKTCPRLRGKIIFSDNIFYVLVNCLQINRGTKSQIGHPFKLENMQILAGRSLKSHLIKLLKIRAQLRLILQMTNAYI